MMQFLLVVFAYIGACIWASDVDAKPMTFTLEYNGGNCVGCEWLQGDGEITDATPSALEALLRQEQGAGRRTLYLNSPGGNLTAGIKLGDVIRKAGLNSNVGRSVRLDAGRNVAELTVGECSSACAFSFLGGVERTIDFNSKLGVHQFYRQIALRDPNAQVFTGLDLSREQLVSALLIEYVFRMGVDPRFMTLASLTPPSDMRYLSREEANELKVLWNPNELDPWAIEPFGAGMVAFSKSKDKRTTVTAFCRRDKSMRILVTNQWSSIDLAKPAFQALNGVDVLGITVARDSLSLRTKGSTAMFEIVLPSIRADSFNFLKPNDFQISTFRHAPSFANGSFFWKFPSDGFGKAYALAQRNCI